MLDVRMRMEPRRPEELNEALVASGTLKGGELGGQDRLMVDSVADVAVGAEFRSLLELAGILKLLHYIIISGGETTYNRVQPLVRMGLLYNTKYRDQCNVFC